MSGPGSIVDVIRAHADQRPDDPACAFLAAAGSSLTVRRRLTYGELDAEATAIAAGLRTGREPGSRVLVAAPPGVEFLTSFLGAVYAGLLPVPVPSPAGSVGVRDRLDGIAVSSGAVVVLTDGATVDDVRAWAARAAPDAVCLSAGEAAARGRAGGRHGTDVDPDGLAFLQYTSGSTTDPRGVMVSHANLLANLALIQRTYGVPDGSRVGGWLPPYHDMGLVGTLLLPLFLGGESVVMAPATFLRRPALWLEMISEHGVAFSSAPNFAYDMCVRRVPADRVAGLDLSGWRWAVNGAEPVRESTVRRFAQHLAPAGFRADALCPSYGMAETTLFVSGNGEAGGPVVTAADPVEFERHRLWPAVDPATAKPVVASGRVPDGFDMRIVDPDSGQELPPGAIGEIWLAGPSVARGYWDRAEETERVFGARTAAGTGPFLRTGDLGAVHAGRLHVTGRIKEVLFLNGRNLYPQDLEQAARELHPACADGAGAAFAVSVGAETERVVLVQEIRGGRPDDDGLRDAARAVTAGLAAEFGVALGGVVFVRAGRVLRSTSGKIRRVAMRRLFEDAESLSPVLEVLDAEVTRAFRRAPVSGPGSTEFEGVRG